MIVAKPLGKNPRDVASQLAAEFSDDPDVTSVEVAGPGFLNFRLNRPIWQRVLKSIDVLGGHYGQSDIGHGEKVNVEYVSANPTGPMHVGIRAARCSATRSPRSWFMSATTSRANITSTTRVARSTFWRSRRSCATAQALGETIEIPAGFIRATI